jgi:hypothetical protein
MDGERMPESLASRSLDQGGSYYRLTLVRKHSTLINPGLEILCERSF